MLIANSRRIMQEVLAEALMPPPLVDYLAWAESNIVFDDGPFRGPIAGAFPFFDEVLRALGPEDPCRLVTMTARPKLARQRWRQFSPSPRCRRRGARSWLSIRP